MVHGSQRPRTFTSHSVITGGFFLVVTDVYRCLPTSCPHTLFLQSHPETLGECALERARDTVGSSTHKSACRKPSTGDGNGVYRYEPDVPEKANSVKLDR